MPKPMGLLKTMLREKLVTVYTCNKKDHKSNSLTFYMRNWKKNSILTQVNKRSE